MKILIYGINYSPELIGIGKYTGEMAVWLASEGHSVRVVTAPPYYPEWCIRQGYKNTYSRSREDDVSVTRCPLFVPTHPTVMKRLFHLFSFSLSSSVPVLSSIFWKPDFIIQVAPTLFCSIQTLILSKLLGAKAVIHIQDFEVDAMFGLSMARSGFIKNIAYRLEKKILNSFDYVSTISEGMMARALKKGVGVNKLIFFPNWSEVERFQNIKQRSNFLVDVGVDRSKKIILYSGNMGEKQGLEIVIDVAKRMQLNSDVHFLMVGEGAAKEKLQNLATEAKLANMTFLPLQSAENFPELLSLATCHLVIQKSGAADAVLPSKLTNILAAGGNAIITAESNTTLGRFCSNFNGIATLVEPESATALHEGILSVLTMPKFNHVARKYANDYLDKNVVIARFVKDIDLVSKNGRSSDSQV